MKDNQCHWCYRFCKYEEMDSYTPYGCSSYDPPEPYDPTYICKACSRKLKDGFVQRFKKGNLRYGHWCKSDAEREAAKKCKLVWIGNNSRLGHEGKKFFNEYIPQELYDKLLKSTG